MVFLGDISVPSSVNPSVSNLPWGRGEIVVGNLEGDIVKEGEALTNERAVFNSRHVLDFLFECGITAVSIANNHILDVHCDPSQSVGILEESGISCIGAGESLEEARQPIRFSPDDGPSITLLAFGWEVIDCSIATPYEGGVNPLTKSNVLRSVRRARSMYPRDKIFTLMHWNYELELFPQPMHRQLAFRAIDMGADAVIGTHSHRVQGIEFYRGAPVVYDLGNWFFAQGEYFDGTLSFPSHSSTELAFEWTSENERMICHWFEYDHESQNLLFQGSEEVRTSERVRKLTPFGGMSHKYYIDFFKNNRIKNKLLPVYSSYDKKITNRLKNIWIFMRKFIISLAISIGLKDAKRS